MKYSKKYDWKPVDEEKGWETERLSSDLHKVKVKEFETGGEETQWFNFDVTQTQDDSWKRHVDQWIERITAEKPSVL